MGPRPRFFRAAFARARDGVKRVRRTLLALLASAVLLRRQRSPRWALRRSSSRSICRSPGRAHSSARARPRCYGSTKRRFNAQNGIHGAPVEFTFLDDQSNPQVALQLVTAAVANKPTVVLGGGTVAACLAIAPLMANGPVQYCLSPAMQPAAGSYSFAVTTR